MAGQRIIAQNRFSRIRIPNRGIATPQSVWTGGAAAGAAAGPVGSVLFAPSAYKFPFTTLGANPVGTTSGSTIIQVAQPNHGYSIGQQVSLFCNAAVGGVPQANLNGIVTVLQVPNANQWNFIQVTAATSAATGGGATVTVQNLTPLAVPVVPGAVYQDATPGGQSILPLPAYAALAAFEGPYFGTLFNKNPLATVAQAAPLSPHLWNGLLWWAWNNTREIHYLTTGLGNFSGVIFQAGPAAGWAPTCLTPCGSRLIVSGNDASSPQNAFIQFITDNVTIGPAVNIGNVIGANPATIIWRALEVTPGASGIYLALMTVAGPIWRTTNGGTAWGQITSTLSTPAVRRWCGIWASGGTIYMIGEQEAFASSTDQGVTWTVNAAVANAKTVYVPSFAVGGPAVFLDQVRRVGYVVNTDSSLSTFSLDNPMAGFTVVLPPSTFPNTAFSPLFALTSTAFWVLCNTSPMPGLWTCPLSNLTAAGFRQANVQVPCAGFSVSATPPGISTGSIVAFALEWEGFLTTVQNGGKDISNAIDCPLTFQFADGVNTIDRYAVADPFLPSGVHPFIRVQ